MATTSNVSFAEPFVNLIEPNNVNINTKIVNGIPQYQDMFIFAELTAVRKARTVLVETEQNKYRPELTGLENTVTVNFLGNNQNVGVVVGENKISNPNYLNFTTNYYQGSSGNETQYEGFGITDIKISINSSFVPQVNIQFVDIRGNAFFNQQNSPYRILFDFPPPIFDLTIKGYYGKALTYRLHLVKYTSEFKAENGNFVIDAQFIAVTYAPLTDVLFRYIVNFPIMERNRQGQSMTPAPDKKPRNTDELVKKIKTLVPKIAKLTDNSDESEKFNSSVTKIESNKNILNMLNAYPDDLNNGTPYLIMQDTSGENTVGTSKILVLSNMNAYDQYIEEQLTDNEPVEIPKRLLLGYYVGPVKQSGEWKYQAYSENQIRALNEYKAKLIAKIRSNESAVEFDDTDIEDAKPLTDTYDAEKNIYVDINAQIKYVTLDITNIYVKLKKNLYYLNRQKLESGSALNDKINTTVLEELGMMPTIYNIFKIILDDVDTFFQTIRTVSEKSENEHHNIPDYYKIITGDDYGDSLALKRVFAFPLIINKKATVCGGYRTERVAPIKLSERLPKPFPELDLVFEFINSFFLQSFGKNLENLRDEQNDDGTYVWFPISPLDSTLASLDVTSPYLNVDGISSSNEDLLSQIFRILLNRFYIFGQYAFSQSIYKGEDTYVRGTYLRTYGAAEAVNLATSIQNPNSRKTLKEFADNVKTNGVNTFYSYLNTAKNLSDVYNFNGNTIPLSSTDYAYVNKYNTGFTGVYILPENRKVSLQIDDDTDDTKSQTPVKSFLNDIKKDKTFDFQNYPERFFGFTQENVLYVEDILRKGSSTGKVKNKMDIVKGVCLHTRFLSSTDRTIDENKAEQLLNEGNAGFHWTNPVFDEGALKSFDSIVDVWIKQLQDYDDIIAPIVTGSSKLSAIMFLSNFGYTLGPFNGYPKDLGVRMFQTPAIFDVPKYLPAYIGALISEGEENDDEFINELKDFFISGAGKNMDNNGLYIFADIYDFNHFLSYKDKVVFKNQYDKFINEDYYQIRTRFKDLYDTVLSGVTAGEKKKNLYDRYLNPIDSDVADYYDDLILPLIKRTSMAAYSQTTFNRVEPSAAPAQYQSLSYTNGSGGQYNKNASFFTEFFSKLSEELEIENADAKEQEEKKKRLQGDEDIITQTYYSFKNINDKWLTNPENRNVVGYPFNQEGKKLIDSFVFVDRAMNPIGDTMINPEALIEMYDDPNLSVFSVISQLLSANGFEFFPLQNFMNFESENEWQNCFKIDTGPIKRSTPAFVCMYIGGSSSYPSNANNGFEDDGIVDLASAPNDFSTGDCNRPANDDFDGQVTNNPKFPWREVRAFKVRFGEQNQSMFTGIKIDTKEFPETNESIQILSKIAGDGGPTVSVPKGQNLYNLYENRAYRATVFGLGNAMIQPTQYFQIENVPMFNGAYLILTVEHNITPNKMTTSFSGTKILRFPYPRVLNPATLYGVDVNIADLASFDVLKLTEAIAISKKRLDEFNSVYGVDVSYAQENLDWSKAVTTTTNDDPELASGSDIKFAMIKVTQGTTIRDSQRVHHANGAKANNLKIGYYHYAQQFTDNDRNAIINNAKAQAGFFIINVTNMPYEPDFPLILDMENYEKVDKSGNIIETRKWSRNKENNDLWINTFISELEKSGYKTILYGGKFWFDEYTSANFGNVPLWHAQYPKYPEMTPPTISSRWTDWSAWQFTSNGRINGYTANTVDLNMMRKDFFNKHSA